MLKNAQYKLSSSASSTDAGNENVNQSFDWILASGTLSSYSEIQFNQGLSLLKEKALPTDFFNTPVSAEEGIAKIKDPLWSRICQNISRILGPIAFGEIWKTQLKGISAEGKVAYLVCPSQDIAETIENYHFVVIGALKEFYPSLSSIETEIREE